MFDRPSEPAHAPRLTGLRGTLRALRNFGLVGLGAPTAGDYDSFTAGDGQLVPVCVLGNGPPLVLVHGVGCSHRDWLPVDRTVDVLVSRLRRKIEENPRVPRYIVTLPGTGYKFMGTVES